MGGPAPGISEPLEGTVFISGRVDREVKVGADGRFSVELPEGKYTFTGDPAFMDIPAKACPEVSQAIVAGGSTSVRVVCFVL